MIERRHRLVKGKLDYRLITELQYSDLKFLDLPDLIGKTVTSALKTEDGFILGFDDDTALRVSHWKDLNHLLYLIPSIKMSNDERFHSIPGAPPACLLAQGMS